ncbi:SulP family inorganic anion transporter [Magnetococcus sp. PR-3]|uniref:SulP family inorganic anion transporter n=1 Tax=Magnetococcus sp. PR-3 TaxID=3120355 RepID=UPI002FCE0A3C
MSASQNTSASTTLDSKTADPRPNTQQRTGWLQRLPKFRLPKWLRTANGETIRQDWLAGLTGAVVVLPQGVAFAAIAGLPPQYGLYTAMVPAVIAAFFGSSHHLISGPTTAISIVVFATLTPLAEPGSALYISMALTLAFMAGVIQFGLGISKLGGLINFVSHSAVVGFTSGAALLIATSQMKHLFGVTVEGSSSFVHTWEALIAQISFINPYVLSVGLVTLGASILIKKILPKWPDMLLAMIIGSLYAAGLGVEAHDITLVGAIPGQLPPLSSPDWDLHMVRELASGALAIALLGLIEAVSIARSVALKSGQTIDGNKEFVGQGLSNIVGSFFSAYPSSGSFTRSGVNYRAGAKTPMSGIFASIMLVILVLAVAPLAAHLPIAAMAGIILKVAFNLIDFHHIKKIGVATRPGLIVMLVTFVATLLLELEFAIYIGVLLSLMFYLNRTSHPKVVTRVPDPASPWRMFVTDHTLPECPQLKILRIDGSLYYGSVPHVEEKLKDLLEDPGHQKNLLIIGSGINFTDLSGAELLLREAIRRREQGGHLFLYDVKEQVCGMFKRSGCIRTIREDHVFRSKTQAIGTIVDTYLDSSHCERCPAQIFLECPNAVKAEQKIAQPVAVPP